MMYRSMVDAGSAARCLQTPRFETHTRKALFEWLERLEAADHGREPAMAVAHACTLQADIVWLHDAALEPGRLYDVEIGTREMAGKVAMIDHRFHARTSSRHAVGRCRLELTASVRLGEDSDDRRFLVIDRLSNAVVGVGRVRGVWEARMAVADRDGGAFDAGEHALTDDAYPTWQSRDMRSLLRGIGD